MVLLDEYELYLREERGLTAPAARQYREVSRAFLSRGRETSELTTADVTAFVLREARTCSVGYAKLKVTALRSFLSYLFVQGRLARDLRSAVPSVAGWRLSSLPRGLAPDVVRRLLRSCDRRRPAGRRDYAVMLLMLRLGLRAREIAALELEDLDWVQGELTVRGKGRQLDRLPLPHDLGRAIAAYLRQGRRETTCRALFVTAKGPVRRLGSCAVPMIVQVASRRCGLGPLGAHRLRHTAATEMLRGGASLPQIAQALRHRSVDTTAIYAKVDRTSLRTVARAWPGAER